MPDPVVLGHQFRAFELCSSIADRRGKAEESIDYLTRAVALGEHLVRDRPDYPLVRRLASRRYELAWQVAHRRDYQRAWSLIAANVRIFYEAPLGVDGPATAIRRVSARVEPGRFAAWDTNRPSEDLSVVGLDPLPALFSAGGDQPNPEAWARSFARVLRSTHAGGEVSPYRESEIGYSVIDFLVLRAAGNRHAGRLEEARRIADRIRAFAEQLVARYPDQAVAHLALGEAHLQSCKNAWRSDDRAAVEGSLRLSGEAARRALLLDPGNAIALRDAADRRRRLDGFLAQRGDADSLAPSARPRMRN